MHYYSKSTRAEDRSLASQHIDGPGRTLWFLRIVFGPLSTVIQVVCATVISQYDPTHTALARHPLPQSLCLVSSITHQL